jgi:hypothetical protein
MRFFRTRLCPAVPAVIVFFIIFSVTARGVNVTQERIYDRAVNSFSISAFARAFRSF